MKSLILDIVSFLKTLTFIDYVLYFAILILIILVASLVYLLKTTNIDEEELYYEDDDFDIKDAVEEISQSKPQNINLTDYEKEQEEKAIISYQELVNSIKKNKINYEDDEIINDDIKIRKINLDNLVSEEIEESVKVRVMTFEHEEAFLEALKKLQKLLN